MTEVKEPTPTDLTARQAAVLRLARRRKTPLTAKEIGKIQDPDRSTCRTWLGYDRAYKAAKTLTRRGLLVRLPGRPARFEPAGREVIRDGREWRCPKCDHHCKVPTGALMVWCEPCRNERRVLEQMVRIDG